MMMMMYYCCPSSIPYHTVNPHRCQLSNKNVVSLSLLLFHYLPSSSTFPNVHIRIYAFSTPFSSIISKSRPHSSSSFVIVVSSSSVHTYSILMHLPTCSPGTARNNHNRTDRNSNLHFCFASFFLKFACCKNSIRI